MTWFNVTPMHTLSLPHIYPFLMFSHMSLNWRKGDYKEKEKQQEMKEKSADKLGCVLKISISDS